MVVSDVLKRLLVVQSKDALDTKYDMSKYDLQRLIEEKYIVLTPKIELPEHDEIRSFIVLSFDKFTPSSNPEVRNCMLHFDVVCHHDTWELGNYRQRPFKILGYIDGILNKAKLSGIGELQFMGCSGPVVNANVGMFSMVYRAMHGSDDILPDDEYNGV